MQGLTKGNRQPFGFCKRTRIHVDRFAVCVDRYPPRFFAPPRHEPNAAPILGFQPLSVLAILRMGRFTQVVEDIVGGVSVFVVNLIFGPLSSDIKPSETMGEVNPTSHIDLNRALF